MDVVQHIRHKLNAWHIPVTSRILVGVSGGIDSMVLLYALHQAGFTVTAAHVNFSLRGDESVEDEAFVEAWCKEQSIPFLCFRANTKEYALQHQLNIQTSARNIRYDWWNKLLRQNQFDLAATAHHLDDQIETILMNLLRGTGIKGLRGIPSRRDQYIRPLLDISRQEIESFAESVQIQGRMDSSNLSDAYLRNRIRHHLVPMLEDISPGFHARMKQSAERIEMEWNAWEQTYLAWETNHVHPSGDGYGISTTSGLEPFLLRWLETKGIPWNLASDFIMASGHDSGKSLMYGPLCLYRTAEGFYLGKSELTSFHLSVPSVGDYDAHEFTFSVQLVDREAFRPVSNMGTAFVSSDVLVFPLRVRSIEPGDDFVPLGMPGKTKKIQDLLVDRKLEMHEKQRTLVVANPHHILWVIDQQLDDRAKVKPGEKSICRLECKWKK